MKSVKFKLEHDKIYNMEEIDDFIKASINKSMIVQNNKNIVYYNVPCSFDIETTSFYIDEEGYVIDYAEKMRRKEIDKNYNPEKRAIMYVWQFGLNGRVIMGRTWAEFLHLLSEIEYKLNLSENKRLIVYVHNLEYEFQFIRKWLEWKENGIFALEERKPIYAITKHGIEFRCSYLLSGYSLKNLSRDLYHYKVEKMTGDLDYSLLRNSKTPLTEKEVKYCVNDVLVVMAYIKEKMEESYNLITELPLTKTGYVRNYCRNHTLYNEKHKYNSNYISLMNMLEITGEDEFNTLSRAFCGGFTHCNAMYNNVICHDVTSYDFTSSYPFVMVSEKFPMSRAVKIEVESKEQFEKIINDKKFLSVFDIRINNIFTKFNFENYISSSKCFGKMNVVENNGRIVCADYICTTITNIDYNVICQCYSWDSIQVKYMYVYTAQYLPTEFVKCILKFYADKTTLKGVKGKEVEYMLSKNMLNACYGMAVTSPVRPEYIYSNEHIWYTDKSIDIEKKIEKNNHSKRRFLYYIWGIFVTAYARRNLFTGIIECKNDYIYSDTDSIKLLNVKNHENYFKAYNLLCEKKLKKASEYHKVDFSFFAPKTQDGKIKMLGVWDYDGHYEYFKTLGAKRYLTVGEEKIGECPFSITVSGVNKNFAVPYLWEKSKHKIEEVLKMFKDGLYIPPEYTGKNIHSYLDYEQIGELTDYLGNTAEYHEKSSVHLEATEYNLSLSKLYTDYLKGIKHREE